MATVALGAALVTGGCGGHGADPAAVVDPVAHAVGPNPYACPPGDVVDDAKAGGMLPTGAVAVRECPWPDHPAGDLSGPLEARVLTTGVDDLVSTIDRAPTVHPDLCPADAGLDVALAFFYPDGAVRTALVGRAGCSTAIVGGATRAGDELGRRVLDTLVQRLDRQSLTAR